MRKILLPVNILLLSSTMMFAQLDANRSANTKLVDALAQMPAGTQAVYNQALQDITSTGESGVAQLLKMRSQTAPADRVSLDYALNGLSVYVLGLKDATARKNLQNAYIAAIKNTECKDSKAFFIRQLRMLGTDESVDFLASMLNDEYLSGYAARALVSNKSEKAQQALLSALNTTSPALKKNIINALGESQTAEAEALLLQQVGKVPETDSRALYYALGRCGGEKSLSILANAAKQVGYTMEYSGANDAYITLIGKMAATGNTKLAEKHAKDLMKQSEKANQQGTRAAALDLFLDIQNSGGQQQVLNALNDANREYRNAALMNASGFADEAFYDKVASKLKKAKPETQADIINWLGVNRVSSALPDILPMLESKNPEVRLAAIKTIGLIGGVDAINALSGLMTSSDPTIIEGAKEALAFTKGDIAAPLMAGFSKDSEAGKIATLQLLALRKSDAYSKQVLALCGDSNKAVQQAAFTTLKDVVTMEELPTLYNMLGSVNSDNISAVQQAIVAAVSTIPESERFNAVMTQMGKVQASAKPRYYTILAATGNPKALDVIVEGFAQGNADTKQQAVNALQTWNGFEAADALYAICTNKGSADFFNQAFNAYVAKVASAPIANENKLIFLRKGLDIAKTPAQQNETLKQIQKTGTFLGLIAAGDYLDNAVTQQQACQTIMNIALNNKSYYGQDVTALLNKVLQVISGPDSQYQKEAIKKHLAELPQDGGYVSIFNGKNLDGWKGLVGNPISREKMTPAQLAKAQEKADEAMRAGWSVEDGCLVFNGKGDNLCTDKKYGDFEMYVDWMLDPAGPEADAGVYLRGTPQVQIWDTSRVNVGAQVGSGGLYNNATNMSKPSHVADNKLGEWNSFYIKMVGERVTVVLNGETVVDNVIMENYWDRKQPIPMLEQIELQAHGSKVSYRDIYVNELPTVQPFELSADEKKEGFKVLFDGTSMHSWTGNTKDYVAEDGCIVLYPQNHGGGNLYSKEEYKDFVLRFDFQLTKGANNGLGIRTPMEGDAAYVGMELQILDGEDPIYKDITPYQHHGSVYGIIPAKRGFMKPVGEWNTQEVIAKGNKIKVILNGEVIVDGDIKEATANGTPDKREHPGLFNEKGHIGFLGHGSVVKFKDIRIKDLK